MLKKSLSTSMIFLLINLVMAPAVWGSETKEKGAKLEEKVKSGIAKLGTGTESKVKLKLKDGTKIKGYISEISEDQFVVKNEKTGESVNVAYSRVKQVKGNNLSKQTAIIIGFAAFFVLLFVILVAQKDNT